jgi:hypothetical protein
MEASEEDKMPESEVLAQVVSHPRNAGNTVLFIHKSTVVTVYSVVHAQL